MSYEVRTPVGTLQSTTLWVVVAAALLGVAPLFLGGFQTSLLAETLIFVLFATAFNLLYGYTGLLSFGHAMFIAVAGYTVAKTVSTVGPALGLGEILGGVGPLVTWVLALVLGVLMATLLAVFIGYLSVRLEEIYFALITLAFSMAIFVMFLQDTIGELLAAVGYGSGDWSNGSDGLTFLFGQVDLLGFNFRVVNLVDPFHFYYIALLVVALGMYALWRIVRSPFGMVCKAIRENPERARALGIDVTFHQWMTFILSGAFSGVAGVLLVTLNGSVNPEANAHWSVSADPVVMTVIGGPYAFLGPAAGAFTYEYLRWIIRQFPLLEQYWQFSFGILLLIVVLFFDNGVAGGLIRFRNWLRVAWGRFQTDGVGGVVSLVGETIQKWIGAFRDSVSKTVGNIKSAVGNIG